MQDQGLAVGRITKGGEKMLSPSFDIAEFMNKVKKYEIDDIIYLTDKEATEVERCIYKGRSCSGRDERQLRDYALILKDLILYMRHGLRTKAMRHLDLTEFGLSGKGH